MRTTAILLGVAAALALYTFLQPFTRAENDADVLGDFGEPIPGLSAFDLFLFEQGKEQFLRRFQRDEGLGPHFNATSCNSCHEDPGPGGSSQRYRDFFLAGRRKPDGGVAKLYQDCTAENQDTHRDKLCLPSIVMPHYGPHGRIADPVTAIVEHPPISGGEDIVVARRNAPPLFGVGLLRLVSDEEILSRVDPGDEDGDGISGRVNIVGNENDAIGRFGYKCQTASIEAFNRGALHNQMGVTSDSTELIVASNNSQETSNPFSGLFEIKKAYAQVAKPKDRIFDYDGISDPEISRIQLLSLVFFQENLAAPRRGLITASARRGEAVFERIGCTNCHTPSLSTSIGMIHPYSDVLIHDMGPDLADGISMHAASGSEFRTQPLWGLCEHAPFLHDGSADTVQEAILRHSGEAQAARDEYAGLSDEEKQYLHRFLESL